MRGKALTSGVTLVCLGELAKQLPRVQTKLPQVDLLQNQVRIAHWVISSPLSKEKKKVFPHNQPEVK